MPGATRSAAPVMGTTAPVNESYRERDARAPFGILIRIAAIYLQPEAGQYESLRWRTHGQDDEEIRAFKPEFRAAVSDPGNALGAPGRRRVACQCQCPRLTSRHKRNPRQSLLHRIQDP